MKRNLNSIEKMSDGSLPEADIYYVNQRLHYLVQVVQQLTVARDLNAIMAAVRTGARQLTNADGATFVLREGDLCHYADEDAISPLWKGGRFPIDTCISGWVMLNQQSAIIEDIYADPRIPVDAYRPTFVKSLVMVPIRTRDPLGAIGNYWATHHTPTLEELNLLQALADAAAVALENLRLYEEQEQRIRERTAQLQRALDFEALLKRITDKVRDSLDEHQILATVVQELAQGLASNCCSTMLYDLAQATATICCEYKYPQLTVVRRDAIAMADFPELYRQLLLGETLQFCRLSLPQAQPTVDREPLILICPIIDDQRVLGDIQLYRTSAEPFAEFEVRLVQQVANQCAIALRQARLHAAVQVQVHELERLNQLKDDFLSTVSHELRSPMTTMRMAVQMLETVLGVLDGNPAEAGTDVVISQRNFSKAVSYLQILNKECQRETNLINDLLDLSRLEAEVSPGIVQDVVLQEFIPQVAESFQERAQQRQQRLQLHVPEQLPPLRTNLMVLERILRELLQNACKYTPAGETITLSAVACEAEQAASGHTSSSFLLTVSNSGIEISERDRACIFDKFYRVPNSDPWKNEGTGLGLALVKQLVEQLSGSVEVSSSENLVCFTVRLTASPE